jgi:hypothetical protein
MQQELNNKADEYQKINDIEFKTNSKNINFTLRNKQTKYYFAYQCSLFTRNLLNNGYDKYTTKEEIVKNGICFNKYSINVGYSQYCKDLKRFNNKEEMLGFVIGYNQAIENNK